MWHRICVCFCLSLCFFVYLCFFVVVFVCVFVFLLASQRESSVESLVGFMWHRMQWQSSDDVIKIGRHFSTFKNHTIYLHIALFPLDLFLKWFEKKMSADRELKRSEVLCQRGDRKVQPYDPNLINPLSRGSLSPSTSTSCWDTSFNANYLCKKIQFYSMKR